MASEILLTIDEAREAHGIGRDTMYRMVHAGEIASVKIGRNIRIPASEVARFGRVHEKATLQPIAPCPFYAVWVLMNELLIAVKALGKQGGGPR